MCANSSKERRYLKEGESVAYSTVYLEEIFTILILGEYEGRDVATLNVPGDYLHADMSSDKIVILKLQGNFVDMMCEINPEHKANVRY